MRKKVCFTQSHSAFPALLPMCSCVLRSQTAPSPERALDSFPLVFSAVLPSHICTHALPIHAQRSAIPARAQGQRGVLPTRLKHDHGGRCVHGLTCALLVFHRQPQYTIIHSTGAQDCTLHAHRASFASRGQCVCCHNTAHARGSAIAVPALSQKQPEGLDGGEGGVRRGCWCSLVSALVVSVSGVGWVAQPIGSYPRYGPIHFSTSSTAMPLRAA